MRASSAGVEDAAMLLRFLLAAAALLLLPPPRTPTRSSSSRTPTSGSPRPTAPTSASSRATGRPTIRYRSPSQADDGTVAASHLDSIRLIRRDGTLIRELDPLSLVNSVSHAMDGTPVDVALSPDGKTNAYTFVERLVPGRRLVRRAAPRPATSSAGGAPLPGNLYLSNPSWAGNSRTLRVRRLPVPGQHHDLGAAEDVHWFDDDEIVGQRTRPTWATAS